MSRIRHGKSSSPEYWTWWAMLQRCKNPNHPAYLNYGGRGISVCERWEKFPAFFEDMGHRPHGGTLERVDNNAGYSPENCRWATRKEQQRNLRRNRWLTYQGRSVLVSDLAEQFGMKRATLYQRIFGMGWPIEKAVNTPVQRRGI
jgi:hypothetical protein